MTKLNTILLICVLMISSIITTNAQDRRTLQTKVADILAQMPTNDLKHRDRVMQEMIDLGDAGFAEFMKLVKAPGNGNDAAVRVAMNSAARYASKFGKEECRAFMEKSFLDALSRANNKEVKAFYIHQLKLVATNASVGALKSYLSDERLCDPATQTLLAIKSADAITALDNALTSSTGKQQIRLVKAAAESRSTANLDAVIKLAGSKDKTLRKEAQLALAQMGAPKAYSTLWNAAKKANFTWESTIAAEAFVIYAERLAQNGHTKLAEKAVLSYVKAAKKANQLSQAASMLRVYINQIGTPAMSTILAEAQSSHKAYREAILHHAQKAGGIAETRQWIELAKSANADVKTDVVAMLGRRGCPVATQFVVAQLADNAAPVRQAAITALAQLEGTAAVPTLIKHMSGNQDVNHTKSTLFYLLDKAHVGPVATAIETANGAAKAALVEIVANKAANQYFDKVMALTNASDAKVKAAAFKSLQNLAQAKDLSALIELLLSANDDNVKATQMAVVASARQIKKNKQQVAPLLKALENTSKKERIITILPYLGGQQALKAVSQLFQSDKYKDAAFDALVNWKDHTASASLYQICKQQKGNYTQQAFNGFMKQVTKSSLPVDQKLLQYRKIMPFATSTKAKNQVLKAIGKVPTITALMYVAPFLNDSKLQQAASRAAMFIALPASGSKAGLYGDNVKKVLEKAANIMSGAESDYYKINIRKYLKEMPSDKGFVSMFNGKDLTGWKGLVANPIARAKMTKAQLAKAQKEADAKMSDNWSVKDGSIVFNGHGANLCSVKDYADFEMIVDWRISPKGDSGIYLRGTPQVQIWDTTRVEVGAQVGSGGLYNNQKHQSKPLKVADNPINEWNTFRIKMIGDKVTVYLNGELVVDNVTMENYWDRKMPIFPKGAIELQAHGTDLAFRDIYVREINEKEFNLTAEEKANGFEALFNGKNLNGWVGNKTDYIVENGEIVVRPKQGGHGNLFTEKEYSDFIYRFEFQLTPGANNGLGIHAPLEGDAAYMGMELQILDNTASIYANLKPYQYHGSVYGVIPAKRGFLKPVGEWNYEEVYVKGSHIKITLNGTVIVDGDYKEASKNGTLDHRNHPGLKRDKGHIGFLGHGSVVKFRNIRLKDLRK
ncbi:DUF1080 domain-containing protein [Prolixibacteraceae bacterium JC049]|nr:DUF1080 domain-containing protein [Prolixibacteraceae bacterium JC049]